MRGARAFRLPDDGGPPRYQILVHVRNDEAAPGVVSMNWAAGREAGWGRGFHVPARTSVELGLVAWEPPLELNLDTPLPPNRDGTTSGRSTSREVQWRWWYRTQVMGTSSSPMLSVGNRRRGGHKGSRRTTPSGTTPADDGLPPTPVATKF